MLEAVAEAGIGRDQVMVGTGMCAAADSLQLTRHALRHGFSNVLVLPPFYYKASVEQLSGARALRLLPCALLCRQRSF